MTACRGAFTVWQRKGISDLFDIRASGDIDWSRWNLEQDTGHPFPVYANGRTDSGLHGFASYAVEEGDALTLTARGTPGELGFAFFRASAFTPIGRLLVLRSKGEVDARFFASYINAVVRFAQENTGVAQLTAPQVARYRVDVPPLSEQRAIAEALGDVDRLLGGLDRLIAKKRDLKQAAMQQLLTGQTRLPGFHGEWEVKRFGELTHPRSERVDPRRSGVHVFCVELEHIEPGTGRLLDSASTSENSSLKSVFRDGDILFGKLRAYLRKYWLATKRGVCSTEIWVFAPNTHLVTSAFLYQLVRVDRFIDTASTAYGTHMPRSDWNVVRNCEFGIPTIAEQTAIAEVLSDMDAEIAALEQRREKTRALKQAMMQELLTGRIRLV